MAWMLYMLQRRIKMNPETLLGLISGGRYQTSADLPTAHSFMDDLIQKQESKMSEVLYPAGKNIFGQPTEPVTQEDLLSLVMGTLGTAPGQGARLLEGLKKQNVLDEIKIQRGLTKAAKKSPQKVINIAKKEGVDHGDIIARHSARVDALTKKEGELQLFQEWLKLFGTDRAESLVKTQKTLIDFLK